MLGALGIQAVSKYANVVVQLVITMVLARLLTPEQHGTMAIITVFLALFAILSDMGVSVAVVQYKDLTKDELGGLFTFSLLLGLGLTVLFCLGAFPLASIYSDAALVPLCWAASPTVLFSTLNMVPNGMLLRDKRYVAIGVRLVAVSVASGSAAVIAALADWGIYALVLNSVATAALVFLWNWASVRLRFRRSFAQPLRRIVRFSAYQAGFSLVNYFARNLDKMLIGATMGQAPLGYYDKAYRLMQYPLNNLTGLFSSVLQPYLSDYAGRRERMYAIWLEICRMLALVGFAVGALFAAFPGELVTLMFGDQWLPAAPALAALSLSLGVQMVNSTSGAVFQSTGHTDYLFASGLACTAVSVVAILVGVAAGDLAVLGTLISLAYLIHFCLTAYYLVWRVFGVSPRKFLLGFAPFFAATAAAVALSALASSLVGATGAVALITRLAALVAGYCAIITVTGQWDCLRAFRNMRRVGSGK